MINGTEHKSCALRARVRIGMDNPFVFVFQKGWPGGSRGWRQVGPSLWIFRLDLSGNGF
jgi:hypothetical protein